MIECALSTTTHGRYLVEPSAAAPAPLLVGCHGYAESADTQFDRLRAIPGAAAWTVVSVQGLNRFYERRTERVVASWMTRQDRERAISDNLAYFAGLLEAEWRERRGARGIVFAGFSQGVAMAFRAAARSAAPVLGVIAVGGDVPAELDADDLAGLRRVLLLRGARDQFYATQTFENDRQRLSDAGVAVTSIQFDGGHEWSAPVLAAAGSFLSASVG